MVYGKLDIIGLSILHKYCKEIKRNNIKTKQSYFGEINYKKSLIITSSTIPYSTVNFNYYYN